MKIFTHYKGGYSLESEVKTVPRDQFTENGEVVCIKDTRGATLWKPEHEQPEYDYVEPPMDLSQEIEMMELAENDDWWVPPFPERA
jgi:hypothetical protein